MVKTKTKKMVSAAIFAALVLQNTVQHVTVYAEEETTESPVIDYVTDYSNWFSEADYALTAWAGQQATLNGSVAEAIVSNPTFAAVWVGVREAQWFFDNPTLVANTPGGDDTIYLSELDSHVAFYYNASGTKTPFLWYDLTFLNLEFQRVNGITFGTCQDYSPSIEFSSDNTEYPAAGHITEITPQYSNGQFAGYLFKAQYVFNSSRNVKVSCDSYFTDSIWKSGVNGYNSPYSLQCFSSTGGVPTILPNATPLHFSYDFFSFFFSGDSQSVSLGSLPDIGIRQAFIPAELAGWVDDSFHPYLVEQSGENGDLPGLDVPPLPNDSNLPDTGTLNSLTFPPGLPNVAFQDPEIPTDSLPENAVSGASFWFSTFSQMLDALGVKYIVIIFLIIILIMSILKI